MAKPTLLPDPTGLHLKLLDASDTAEATKSGNDPNWNRKRVGNGPRV
jgi:hypothetical protein